MSDQPSNADELEIVIDQVKEHAHPREAAILTLSRNLGDDGEEGERVVRLEHQTLPPVLRELRKHPAGARAHTFRDIDGLIAYLGRYGVEEDLVILLDLDNGTGQACLKELDEEEVETIGYKPMQTPEWQRLAQQVRGLMTPKVFCNFLRVHRPNIIEPQEEVVRLIASRLSAAVKVEEHTGSGSGGSFGRLLKVELRAGKVADDPIVVPDEFRLSLRPFIDSPAPVEITLYLDVIPQQDGAVKIQLSSPELDKPFAVAAADYIKRVREGLPKALVAPGTYRRNAWSYQE